MAQKNSGLFSEILLRENVCSKSPEGVLSSGDCFLSSLCRRACEHFDGGHPVLLRQLKRIVDNDRVTAGTGILLRLLVHLDSADKYPQQFGGQLWHLDIRFCFVHKFLYAFFPHIHLIDALGNGLQLLPQLCLFLLVTYNNL